MYPATTCDSYHHETAVTDTILVWDTTTVPNGTYFARVVASDAPSNAASAALSGELDSAPFEVDNTPPAFSGTIARVDGARTVIAFDVTDDHSPIQRVESSDNGADWKAVFPLDGIADTRTEHYEVVVPGRIPARGLTLRALDSMNNVSTTQVAPPPER